MQHQNKILEILIDGIILFAVSTALVVGANFAFSSLKGKVPKDNPVVAAISTGELKSVEAVLKERGKADTLSTDEHGRTALMRAAYINLAVTEERDKQDQSRSSMVSLLLDHGAEINAVDHDGWTALMWASWSNLPKTARVLLERGCPVNAADRQGNTALTIAAQRGNAAIVRVLLENGANANARTKNNQTALDLANEAKTDNPKARKNYQATVRALGGH